MKKIDIVSNKSDRVLKILEKQCPNITYSALSSALRKKDILVNGERIKENVMLPKGVQITVYVTDNAVKKDRFEIIYEDDNVLFVNKDSGIETCDGEYNVVDELLKKGKKVFAVHRLDRNTLGICVFAKTLEAMNQLVAHFKKGNVEKLYYAEVCGEIKANHTTLHGYLLKNKEDSNVKIFNNKVAGGQEIFTEYTLVKSSGNVSLLSVKIKEGKTHQIRAHLAFNKMYIIGDGKYGKNEINSKYKAKTQHLKAYKILFNLPENSKLNYLNTLNLELDNKF